MNQIKTKIKDIEAFCKLFKINIPVNEDFEYYINTLKRSYEYGAPNKLEKDIQLFLDLEQFVEENGFESVGKYKMKELDRLVEFLTNTQAYKKMLEAELPKDKLYSKDLFNQLEDDKFLVSLDFKSANYNVLKTFDSLENPELTKNWNTLCEKLEVSECLEGSKSFRQIVFGNTNPKRLQTFQHQNIMKVVECLKNNGFLEEELVFIAHDEIVVQVNNGATAMKLSKATDMLSREANNIPIRATIFSLKKIKKNVFIKSVYSIAHKEDLQTLFLKEEYKALHGVPGNKFYMYFKQYILNEIPEEKDLVYFNDGELCKWVIQEEKPKKVQLPHYEKPDRILSVESAKVSYPRLWDQMTLLLPNMTNEEKRRVIEIVANTCKYCYEEPSGCQCWNDD